MERWHESCLDETIDKYVQPPYELELHASSGIRTKFHVSN